MALTISTTPASHVSARRPIYYVLTSTRYDATTNAKTITSVTNSGGYARFNFAGATTFVAGTVPDVITGSGFTETSYNVRFNCTSTGAGYVVSDLAFVSDDTGTITRSNDNFRLKIEVYINTVLFASIYSFADSSGNFNVDIQKIVLASMTIFDRGGFTVGISTGLTNTVKAFYIKAIEYYDDTAGLQQDSDTVTGSTYQALNGAWQHIESSLANYIIASGSTNKFLTDIPSMENSAVKVKIKAAEAFNLSFMVAAVGDVKYAYQRFLNGSSISSHASGTVTLTSIFNILTVVNLFGSGDRIDIWLTTTAGAQISDKVTLYLDSESCNDNLRFKWRNRRGGYDSYTFIDYEENISASKEKYKRDLGYTFSIPDRGVKTIKSESAISGISVTEYLSPQVQNWLQDMINSEDVFIIKTIDAKLTEVPIDVLTNEQPTKSQEHKQFEIEYQMANEIL